MMGSSVRSAKRFSLIDSKKVTEAALFSRGFHLPTCASKAIIGQPNPRDNVLIFIEQNHNSPPWRPRKIASPQQLLDQFVAYAEFVENNPLYEDKVFKTSDGVVRAKLRKDRPMTIASFCIFLGVTTQAWRYWRKNREDLAEAIELIEDAVFVYKFERAAVGIFKANIISRELGRMRHV